MEHIMMTFLKSKWVLWIILVLAIIGGGYWFFMRSNSASYQFVTVTQGSITETVSVTGNTTPTKSVSLGFQNTGTIAHIYHTLGDHVSAGEVIAELNTANLSAVLQQARASLAVAEANLASLMAGTRQEQLTIDQNAVTQSQMALINAGSECVCRFRRRGAYERRSILHQPAYVDCHTYVHRA